MSKASSTLNIRLRKILCHNRRQDGQCTFSKGLHANTDKVKTRMRRDSEHEVLIIRGWHPQ